jgi:hypothetical protein
MRHRKRHQAAFPAFALASRDSASIARLDPAKTRTMAHVNGAHTMRAGYLLTVRQMQYPLRGIRGLLASEGSPHEFHGV